MNIFVLKVLAPSNSVNWNLEITERDKIIFCCFIIF